MDWYESIESGVRNIVKLLRDNGINTTYSCHHAMVIEAENYDAHEIDNIYNILIEAGYDDFIITIIYQKTMRSSLQRHLEVYLDPQRCAPEQVQMRKDK